MSTAAPLRFKQLADAVADAPLGEGESRERSGGVNVNTTHIWCYGIVGGAERFRVHTTASFY